MKTLISCLILLSFIACKKSSSPEHTIEAPEIEHETLQNTLNQSAQDSLAVFSEESLELNQEKTKAIKREKLIKAQDDKPQLQELVVSKKLYKEEDLYILDYQYPYLNEKHPGSVIFNRYIQENYLDIEKTENQILEDKELLCDTLKINRFRDKRIIDYKIYNAKNDLISVVLYKENYYSGMKYSTYLFDCINYDLNTNEFIYFETFFESGSETVVFNTINTIITDHINSGELYYDCWELSEGDFMAYKNNFVVDDNVVKFYFDDCVICPSYTGTYAIEIPISKIMHVLKKYNDPPEVS